VSWIVELRTYNSNPRGKAAKAEDEIDKKHSRENFMVIDCSVSDSKRWRRDPSMMAGNSTFIMADPSNTAQPPESFDLAPLVIPGPGFKTSDLSSLQMPKNASVQYHRTINNSTTTGN
jgi:hypothetical protein